MALHLRTKEQRQKLAVIFLSRMHREPTSPHYCMSLGKAEATSVTANTPQHSRRPAIAGRMFSVFLRT
jgi:hypothetical protein